LRCAELIADRAAKRLRQRGVRVDGRGTQGMLDAALQYDPKLRAVLCLLAERHHERLSAVEQCLRTMCTGLSAPFHATGNAVVVRQVDFSVGTERCAVCGLLETYDTPYTYYDASGAELPASPYALSAEERAMVAAAM
jgi:hypothetical protein